MLRPTLLASLLLLGSVHAAATFDLSWRNSDYKKLGKEVGDYFDAKFEKKGSSDAFQKLTNSIEKLQKKAKDVDVLSLVEDWEEVFKQQAMQSYRDKPKKKGTIYTETIDFRGSPIEIAGLYPNTYTTKGEPFPLVLIAPAPGEDPKAALDAHWIDADLQEKVILCAVRMPQNAELLTELQGADSLGGIGLLMSVYGDLKQRFAIDMNRVFLAGHGEGAQAALWTAACYPHLFAGAIVRSGASEIEATNFGTVPTLWQASGDSATKFEERVKAASLANCTVSAGADTAEVWTWMSDKRREAYPRNVHFAPAKDYALSTGWIRLEGVSVDEGPKIEAQVERDENTITITTEHVVSVRLYLNDVLVDLDRPIQVILNGTTHETLPGRNKKTMIDLVYDRGDWGSVFTATESFDVGG